MTLIRPSYSPGGWTDAPIHPTQPGGPMNTPTPSIPGVDRAALTDAILRATVRGGWLPALAADAALDYIAAHHECACDREHADEWVEVDEDTWVGLPDGTRMRSLSEWVRGNHGSTRRFVHRDDLPDPDAEAANALRDASWNVPRLADGSRPDPLPGLPEARGLLAALREAGWAVVREEGR